MSVTAYLERIVKSIINSGTRRNVLTQAHHDLYMAAMLLRVRDKAQAIPDYSFTKEEENEFRHEYLQMSNSKKEEFVSSRLDSQIIDMFQKLEKSKKELYSQAHDGEPLPSHLYEKSSVFSETLRKEVGFELEVKPSLLPNAGNGLFIKTYDNKKILPGTVIALYPGLVHVREFVADKNYLRSLLPDDDMFIMLRSDDVVIDGRRTDSVPFNPYARGHICNHPGDAGSNVVSHPNLFQVLTQIKYDFLNYSLLRSGFPKSLSCFIPTAYAKAPTFIGTPDRTAFMHTIAFISRSILQDGDELTYDYRLYSGSTRLPTWYIPYDVIGSQRRFLTPDQLQNFDGNFAREPVVLRSSPKRDDKPTDKPSDKPVDPNKLN